VTVPIHSIIFRIWYLDHTDDFYVCLIDQKLTSKLLNNVFWKCYRCDLNFKEKNTASLHESILKHPVRQIEDILVKL